MRKIMVRASYPDLLIGALRRARSIFFLRAPRRDTQVGIPTDIRETVAWRRERNLLLRQKIKKLIVLLFKK